MRGNKEDALLSEFWGWGALISRNSAPAQGRWPKSRLRNLVPDTWDLWGSQVLFWFKVSCSEVVTVIPTVKREEEGGGRGADSSIVRPPVEYPGHFKEVPPSM